MIVQRIIVHKPVITPFVQNYTPAWVQRHGDYIANQEQYNTYMNSLSMNEGDFVTLAAKDSPHIYLHNIHYIAKLETDFDKLNWNQPGKPKPFLLVACAVPPGSNLAPWTRWDSPTGLRLLSAREYDTFVKPTNDILQNSCIEHATKYLQEYPSRN